MTMRRSVVVSMVIFSCVNLFKLQSLFSKLTARPINM